MPFRAQKNTRKKITCLTFLNTYTGRTATLNVLPHGVALEAGRWLDAAVRFVLPVVSLGGGGGCWGGVRDGAGPPRRQQEQAAEKPPHFFGCYF